MNGEDEAARKATSAVLRYVLIALLKMLHPFMPFLTDAVYRHVPGTEGTIMLSDWPVANAAYDFAEAEREMGGVMDVIRAVRNLRAEMNVAVGKRAHLIVRPKAGWEHAMQGAEEYLKRLAWVSEMTILAEGEEAQGKTVSAVSEAAELFIPLGDLVDLDKEIARLTKERDGVEREIQRAEGKLNNPGFVAKAPAALIEQEKAKLEVSKDKLEKLNARIADLQNM
jgi:valyl-tRNA synthetase